MNAWPSLKTEFQIVLDADPKVRPIRSSLMATMQDLNREADFLQRVQAKIIQRQHEKLATARRLLGCSAWLNVLLIVALIYSVWF